jgi:hypothetical protein
MGCDVLAVHDDRLFVPSHPIPLPSVSIMQRYSEDVVREAIRLRASGMSLMKISMHMSICYETLKDWFYATGRATRIMEREAQAKAFSHDNPTVPGVKADPAGQTAN